MRRITHKLLLMVVGLMTGCASTAPPKPLADVQVRKDGYSQTTFTAPITRLDYDLWRAARDLGWGMPYPIKPDDDGHYRGNSIVPDGRPLQVEAWPNGEHSDRFDIIVKIGRFGDAERQAIYLGQLKKILAKKPMPKRGLNFSLDDDKTDQ